MTDDDSFDLDLRRRLEGLATAVPLEPGGSMRPVATRSVRPARTSQRLVRAGFMPVFALVVGAVVLAGVAQLNPFSPGTALPGQSGLPAQSATAAGITDVDTSGPYSLEIRADRRTYRENEPIEVEATFRYAGGAAATILNRSSSLVGFGIDERVYGMQVATIFEVPLSCSLPVARVLEAGSAIVVPFEKDGIPSGNSGDRALQQAFLEEPALGLPPGVWHLYATASFAAEDNGCGTEFTQLRPVIEIEVLRAPEISNPPPSYPAVSPGPITELDGVEATARDGTFDLRISSPKATWLAGTVIDIEADVTYLGPDAEAIVGSPSSLMSYTVTQLDGSHATGSGAADVCAHTTVKRGVPHKVGFDKGGGYSPTMPDFEWLRAYTEDRSFRLTPGTWEIAANLEAGIPSCDDEQHRLRASIVIEVVDAVAIGGPEPGGPLVSASQIEWAAGFVRSYASEHPDTFAALWIDRPYEGPTRIASSWTGDIEAHRAALQEEIGSVVPFALYEAEYTEVELERAREQIDGDLGWLATVPAALVGFGAGGSSNRLELEVSSAVPDAPERIREHYATKHGFDPRILVVTTDWTGATFVPWGIVDVTLDLPPGGVPDGVRLAPGWHSDTYGLRCGAGDVGVGFEDLPCQEGRWTILVEAWRDGEREIVGSGEVDVVAGKTAHLTIDVNLR